MKFFQVRFQYDGYYYFGANGALLSFPSSSSPFGKDEIKSLKGQEESGWGQRINLQPVLTAKAGKFINRNLTDIGYYRFHRKGPYFYEWEYDTLLKSGDYLVNNVTGVLYEGWKPGKTAEFLAGPFYQVTHAASADINRQRIGVEAFWSPGKKQGGSWTPRIYGRLGYNLQDRNREDELFASAGRWVSEAQLDNTGSADFRTPSFFSLDGEASLSLARWLKRGRPRLRLHGTNLLNSRRQWPGGYSYLYFTRDAAGVSLSGTAYYYPQAKRSVFVTLDARF